MGPPHGEQGHEEIEGSVIDEPSTFDFAPQQVADPTREAEVFRWIAWKDLTEKDVSLPIDKVVVNMLKPKDED